MNICFECYWPGGFFVLDRPTKTYIFKQNGYHGNNFIGSYPKVFWDVALFRVHILYHTLGKSAKGFNLCQLNDYHGDKFIGPSPKVFLRYSTVHGTHFIQYFVKICQRQQFFVRSWLKFPEVYIFIRYTFSPKMIQSGKLLSLQHKIPKPENFNKKHLPWKNFSLDPIPYNL